MGDCGITDGLATSGFGGAGGVGRLISGLAVAGGVVGIAGGVIAAGAVGAGFAAGVFITLS